MRVAGRILMEMAVMVVALAGLAQPAAAQISPFRGTKAPPMARADQQALLDATNRLNRREHPDVGGTESWNTATSQGTARLDRIFRAHGTTCHAVGYDLAATPGAKRQTYRVNWCRTAGGEWKTAG